MEPVAAPLHHAGLCEQAEEVRRGGGALVGVGRQFLHRAREAQALGILGVLGLSLAADRHGAAASSLAGWGGAAGCGTSFPRGVNAWMPVTSRPRISPWMSYVPS